MGEYLSFSEICSNVTYKDLLNKLNIGYEEKNGELKAKYNGTVYIINLKKNIGFDCKDSEKKGLSPINFYSLFANCSLRESGSQLKKWFMPNNTDKKKNGPPEYELDIEHSTIKAIGLTADECRKHGVGYVKEGMMRGRVGFKIHDKNGQLVGWIGRASKDGQKPVWLFPPEKFYKHVHVWGLNRNTGKYAILTTSVIEAIHVNRFFPDVGISLLSFSMNSEQEYLLSRYEQIMVLHPQDPSNIVSRLANHCFVYAPKLHKAVKEFTQEDFAKLAK